MEVVINLPCLQNIAAQKLRACFLGLEFPRIVGGLAVKNSLLAAGLGDFFS